MASQGVKAIVLVGGPSKGTRFRPLSLDVAKPLFPIAGRPLIYHHLQACARLSNLTEILIIGFYDETEKSWQSFLEQAKKDFGVPITYLREDSRLGTAGGLKKFKKEILNGNPSQIILMHCDIFCAFPIKEMLEFHLKHGKEATILGKKVPKDEARQYGCLVVDPESNEALHYAEKPQTFVSDVINAGVHIFSPSFFGLMESVAPTHHELDESEDFLRLEQDVYTNICGEKHLYVFQTQDFWLQLKSAGMVVPCSNFMLATLRKRSPEVLAKTEQGGPTIVGDVLIDPTAQVHPSAKLGPNVSIGAKAKIGPGTRISHSIILDNVEVKGQSCISYSVVGWNSSVGKWTRLEGVPDYKADSHDALKFGITILGSGVNVGQESLIFTCIALPHKDLSGNYSGLILL
eukprot:TRINITY_DN10820_c0_g1_i2.p1 TRINITY_DN10820_c0_g1~~TRINITY_DN10820_c0_g1_i2.p1  ORF type:complete len:427 (+),score=111.33 TRINITY_DN10820_c0_g1_i2:71-1282(+)